MKVLIITHFYPPETGGPPNRMSSIADGIRDAGHQVHVVTNVPSHPEGRIWPEYRGKLFRQVTVQGVDVTYCWVYASPKKGFLPRMMNYLSFMFIGSLAALRPRMRYDVVLATSPPLFVGLSGWLAKTVRRVPLVFDVRDLWPDVALALGQIKEGPAFRMAKRLERFIYRSADTVTAVTASFQRAIQQTAGAKTPVAQVMNGAMPESLETGATPDERPSPLPGEPSFLVIYPGNIGIAQGLMHVLDAARLLEQRRRACAFVLLGSGPERAAVEQRIADERIENVHILPRMDVSTAASYIAACDAILVPLRDHPIFHSFIPSKLFDGMASGKPVLLSVDGEAREILERHEAGLYYPPEDGEELARSVGYLMDHPREAAAMGVRGREAARKFYMRSIQAARMVGILEEVC